MGTISIGKNFSRHPIGRFRSDGGSSGEAFREDHLIPALKKLAPNEKLTIILDDGVDGYGSSFLVEAFAGVVKVGFMSSGDLVEKLEFNYQSEDFSFYEKKIKQYISEANFGSEKKE